MSEVTPMLARTSKDYAIEFAGYMAKAADDYLMNPFDRDCARALWRAVYEFRKRADRAKSEDQTP